MSTPGASPRRNDDNDDSDNNSVIVHGSPNASPRDDRDYEADLIDGLQSRAHTPDHKHAVDDEDPLFHTKSFFNWAQMNAKLSEVAGTASDDPMKPKSPLKKSAEKPVVGVGQPVHTNVKEIGTNKPK